MTSDTTPKSKGSQTRLAAVDLLRGAAIFFVLMNHVNMRLVIARIPYTNGLPEQLVSSLVWNGQRGVQIFFAVSGFLITSTALRRWGSLAGVSIRGFYLFRFARIVPLLLLLLLILSGLDRAHVEDFVVSSKTGGLLRALVAALTFHVNLLEARRGYLPGNWDILWSLSVEEMFYLFFPWICRKPKRLLVTVLLVFVALGPPGRTLLAHNNEVWQEYSYLGGMDAIAMGCLTALFVSHCKLSRATSWTTGLVGAVLLIFSLAFTMRIREWGLNRLGLDMTLVALGACLVMAMAAQVEWRAPGVLRPMLILGQRSYEIYLTHMFLVFLFFHLFLMSSKPVAAVPVLFGMVILSSGFLGVAVANWYSEPLNFRIRSAAIRRYSSLFKASGGIPARVSIG